MPAYRGDLSAGERACSFPIAVARIARGVLTYSEQGRLNEYLEQHEARRCSLFNRVEYFYFQFAEQGALMAAFLLARRLHRLVPGSTEAATPEQVAAEWPRMAEQRAAILAWARERKVLMDIVQTYRFERSRGAPSSTAHTQAARRVQQIDPTVHDPTACAGVCIEWAERQNREWFWRCAPDHPFL
ncbi:MAG: hypothetical protein U1E60_25520 [Reyranellaceae bacterium]